MDQCGPYCMGPQWFIAVKDQIGPKSAMTSDSQFKIRLPAALKARLETVALREGKSLTAVIVQRLESSFPSLADEILSARESEIRAIQEDLRASRIRLQEVSLQKAAGKHDTEVDQELKGELDWLKNHIAKLEFLQDLCEGEVKVIKKRVGLKK